MRGEAGLPLNPLPIVYRGYVLQVVRKGTPTESVHIRSGGEVISIVPDEAHAKRVIDEWMVAR